jgi:hypothetical protein
MKRARHVPAVDGGPVGPVGLLGRVLARDGYPGMRATTAHTRALGLFDSTSPLLTRGVPIGDVLSGGGLFVYDAYELYAEQDLTGVSDPNMTVFGKIGQRKSTLVKCLLLRQLGLGRQVWVVDVKPLQGETPPGGEYSRLARALGAGGSVIRLAPEAGVRLNPLAWPENRHELLRAVARAVLPRPLSAREPALLDVALGDVAGRGGEPTLPEVLEALFTPSVEMAAKVAATPETFAAEARDVAMALRQLCVGDLAGMFDGPTSPSVNLDAQMVVLDLSALDKLQEVGIVMSAGAAFMSAARARRQRRAEQAGEAPPKTILVLDEAWRVFSVPGIGEWLTEQFKLSRSLGQQNIAVMHRFSDLSAAGDDGSRMAKLARGLIEDCQTFVLFRLEGDELTQAARILSLSDTERERIGNLQAGQALWKVGAHRQIVQTAVSQVEMPLVNTDKAMAVDHGGRR